MFSILNPIFSFSSYPSTENDFNTPNNFLRNFKSKVGRYNFGQTSYRDPVNMTSDNAIKMQLSLRP